MMKSTKRGKRTETLSLRLDPKFKFMLDYIVRVTGMSITTVVERAIQEYADKNKMPSEPWWTHWSVSEGVRTLSVLRDENVPTSYEDDELLEFTYSHKAFFYKAYSPDEPEFFWPMNVVNVDVLWPKIHEYIETWREGRTKNRYAAGELMADDLKAAGLNPPNWPPLETSKDNEGPQKGDRVTEN